MESRRAALSLFEGQVPCFLKIAEPSCQALATHLAFLVHEERGACGRDEPLPVCEEHRRTLAMMGDPFWRTWHDLAPTLCGMCATPLRVERFEPL